MKQTLKSILVGALITAISSMNALAQSSDIDQLSRDTGPEARVTLTIPIGPITRTVKDKSRLEFGVRQYQGRSNDINWALNPKSQLLDDDYREARFGLTLTEDTTFLLNGQEWNEMNQLMGIDETDVALGAGAIVLIAATVVTAGVIILVIACEDGCYSDDY